MSSDSTSQVLQLDELNNTEQQQTTQENQENTQINDENIQLSHNKVLSTKLKQNAKKLLESLSVQQDKQQYQKNDKNSIRFVPVVFPLKYLNNTYNFNKQDENQRKTFNLHLYSNDKDQIKQKLLKLLTKHCDPKIYNDQKIVQELVEQVAFNYDNPKPIPQLQKNKHSSINQISEVNTTHGTVKAWNTQMLDRKKNMEKFKERQQKVLNRKKQEDNLYKKDIEKKQQSYTFKPQIHKISKEMDDNYKEIKNKYQHTNDQLNDQQNSKQETAIHIQINLEKEKQAQESRKRQFKKLQQTVQERIQRIEKNFETFQNLVNQKNPYDINEFVNHIYNKSVFFKYLLRQSDGKKIIDIINYESIPQTIIHMLDSDKQMQIVKEENDATQEEQLSQKDELYTFIKPLSYIQDRYNKLNINENEPTQDDIYQLRKITQSHTLFETVTDQYFKYMEQKKKELEEYEKMQGEKQESQIQTFVNTDKTFLERVDIHIAEKKRRMKNYEIEKKQREMRDCTFSPEITNKAKKIQQPLDEHGKPVTVFDKLYTEAKTSKILENQDIKNEIEKQIESLKTQQEEGSHVYDTTLQPQIENDQKISASKIKELEHHDQTGGEVINQFYQDLRISDNEIKTMQKKNEEEESIDNFMF